MHDSRGIGSNDTVYRLPIIRPKGHRETGGEGASPDPPRECACLGGKEISTPIHEKNLCAWCDKPLLGESISTEALANLFEYYYCSEDCINSHIMSK